MTSTFTANLALNEQGTGDNSNSWGTVLNTGVISVLDQCLGTKLSLSVAGSSNVTLTTTQSQNLYFSFTGILTGNISVIFPTSAGRLIVVNNATTGAFTLTVTPSGGTGFLVVQGSTQFLQIDGTANVAMAPQNDILPLEVTVASATTTDIGATGTNVIAVSGTTTITSFGSSATIQECIYFVRFTGALILTQNSTSLILPGAASITTAAGDTSIFKYEGSGHWRCLMYQQAAAVVGGTGTVNGGTANQIAYYATTSTAVSGNTALPNGITATTQTAGDNTTKVATDAFVVATIAANVKVNPQVFSANGTYTPTAGMGYCIVECVGPGGGGGGVQTVSSSQTVNGGGGGGGGYARKILSAATIGSSQAVTVGTGGAGGIGANGGSNGSGSTSLGTLCVATAGQGGSGNGGGLASGGPAGIGTTGDLLVSGGKGDNGCFSTNATTFYTGGNGGSSYFSGSVCTAASSGNVVNGLAGLSFGGGGSGAWSEANTGSGTGGAGASGYVFITEYLT